MTTQSALALALATVILGLSPGPAVFATIGRAISMPLARVYLFILGIVVGDAVFAMLAMGGLAILAQQFAMIFTVLKIIGGAYLIYLGARSWNSSTQILIRDADAESAVRLFTSGFLLTSGNPKDLLFFVGFLPLFIDLNAATFMQMATAAGVIVAAFLVTLSVYAIGGASVKNLFSNERAIVWLHRIAAVMICCVGLAVIIW